MRDSPIYIALPLLIYDMYTCKVWGYHIVMIGGLAGAPRIRKVSQTYIRRPTANLIKADAAGFNYIFIFPKPVPLSVVE